MPPPHASTVSLRPAPAPNMASSIASTVSDMHTTHESGIQRWVKRDRLSPRLPMSWMIEDMGIGCRLVPVSMVQGSGRYGFANCIRARSVVYSLGHLADGNGDSRQRPWRTAL